MFRMFEASTADGIWQKVTLAFQRGVGVALQPSRDGNTREILHAAICLADPRQRWMHRRRPPMNPAFAIAEVVWIVSGRNDSRLINFFCSQYAMKAGCGSAYRGAYGHRLRRQYGVDQLTRAYDALRHNPDSRQIVLQIWDGRLDLPSATGKARSKDIPCNVVSLLKVRGGALEWTQVIRSNDVFLGLPHNIVQFTTLQEVLAGWLGLRMGAYHQLSDSLHVYERDDKKVLSPCGPSGPPNTDGIDISKPQSVKAFAQLSGRIDQMIKRRLTPNELLNLADWPDAKPSFRNMLLVLCAETARRRRWFGLPDELMSECTNPAFVRLWHDWADRKCDRVFAQKRLTACTRRELALR